MAADRIAALAFELNLNGNNMNMKQTVVICATLVIIAGLFNLNVSAQSSDTGTAIAMTGDKDATWVLTSDNELIYCWWPESPDRITVQAKCRVLNRWRVERTQ